MALTIAHRFGSVMPFVRVHSREDDRYTGAQLGITTYHSTDSDEETYRTSYIEVGGRSDHLAVPFASAVNADMEPLKTDTVSSEDAGYVRSTPESKVTPIKVAA